jgi:molybdate transport system substrate-binding protein
MRCTLANQLLAAGLRWATLAVPGLPQRVMAMRWLGVLLAFAFAAPAAAGEVKVLSTGAMREVVLALVPPFAKETGHRVTVEGGSAGALARRIGGGEGFDVVVTTESGLEALARNATIDGKSRVALARVGIGVVVKADATVPDVSSVEAFKQALVAAKSVGYMDPASGATSGAYVADLIERLGLGPTLKPKTVLVRDGPVALHVARGEIELGLHQISEILPVAGARLAGPLPAPIQNVTTYAAAVGVNARDRDAAQAFVRFLAGPAGAAAIRARGMDPG